MKKEKIFFHPIDGTGSLTISWSSESKGDAVEAKKGNGVGFFSKNGDLLSVTFDEVQEDSDDQSLDFERDRVEIQVNKGQITYTLIQSRSALLKTAKRNYSKSSRTVRKAKSPKKPIKQSKK